MVFLVPQTQWHSWCHRTKMYPSEVIEFFLFRYPDAQLEKRVQESVQPELSNSEKLSQKKFKSFKFKLQEFKSCPKYP